MLLHREQGDGGILSLICSDPAASLGQSVKDGKCVLCMPVNVNFLHGAVSTVNSSGGGRETAGVHCVSERLYQGLESSFNPSLR